MRSVSYTHLGNIFCIPFVLLYIVYGAVAAVCEFINFTMAFADHTAKLKALAETADTAKKI